jgi:hypothetical protein
LGEFESKRLLNKCIAHNIVVLIHESFELGGRLVLLFKSLPKFGFARKVNCCPSSYPEFFAKNIAQGKALR